MILQALTDNIKT